MKHTLNTTSESRKSTHRDILLAIAFLIIALLMLGALSTMAQNQEYFKATRYGKDVLLTKDKSVCIVAFSSVTEDSTVLLKWKTKNISKKGVYAVIRSEDGINYSYVSLQLAVKGENIFVVKNNLESKHFYYRVLYISEHNTFCLTERKNVSDVIKETTTQQP